MLSVRAPGRGAAARTPGGFSSDPNVRIELPGNIGKASRMLKMVGMGPRSSSWKTA